MDRKALLIGIENYKSKKFPNLSGVIKETERLEEILSKDHDGKYNYHCDTLLNDRETVRRSQLRNKLIKFFNDKNYDECLLYFSGHGSVKGGVGFLCTSEATLDDPGISFFELQSLAMNSHHDEVIIILDCCFSGEMFQISSQGEDRTSLRKGMAILAAASSEQSAEMSAGGSIFTKHLIDGLKGQAGDVVGKVTLGSLYRHLEQLLSLADQRPQFAAYLERESVIRKCKPALEAEVIRELKPLFQGKLDNFPLEPAYEPEAKLGDTEKERQFRLLQKFAKVGFVVPVGEEHMYDAAMNSKSCKLTPLGHYYRQLVLKKQI
ncbi:MAG: caspase family protein [Bacteroidota bacterium]